MTLKFDVRSGVNWVLLNGKEKGETYEEIKDDTEEYCVWDHPFDMHFKTRSVRGWPKFFVEVWEVDVKGRYSLAGYGIATVPSSPGQHALQVKCWRPKAKGYFNQLASRLLGIQPELDFKDLLFSGGDRFGFETESTGTVEIDIGVICKDFPLQGVKTYTEV